MGKSTEKEMSVTQPGQQPGQQPPSLNALRGAVTAWTGNTFNKPAAFHIGDVNHVYNDPSGDPYERCVFDLKTANPKGDKDRIIRANGGLLPEAHSWLLRHDHFKDWKASPDGKVLWVKGDAGKGKTMLLCGIADSIKEGLAKQDNLSYFFCQDSLDQNPSAVSVIKGLVSMLVVKRPSLMRHVRERYDNLGPTMFSETKAQETLRGILVEILGDLSEDATQPTTYLLIDALDKCMKDRAEILDLILESMSIARVKWLVTSRAWDDIEAHLGSGRAENSATIDLNEHDEAVSSAIETWINRCASSLIPDTNNSTHRQKITEALQSKARNVTFRPPALLAKQLKGKPESEQRELLVSAGTAAGEDEFYEQVAEDIQHQRQTSESCRRILAFVAIAYRSLTHAELSNLVSPDGDRVRHAMRLCRHFFALASGVYTLDQPARAFLCKDGNNLFPSGFGKYHGELFSRSMKVMAMTLQRDPCNLQHPGASAPPLDPSEETPLVQIRYLCTHWIYHLLRARSTRPSQNFLGQDIQDLIGFLTGQYLHWLESLSLFHETGTLSLWAALLHCLRAESKSEPRDDALRRCVELAQDADGQLKNHIIGHPLQAYVSALIFAPPKSLANQTFGNQKPDWVETCFKVEGRNPCTRTLDLGAVVDGHVCFFPDGHRVAVVVLEQSQKRVRILNLQDGGSARWSPSTDGWIAFPPTRDVIAVSKGGKVGFYALGTPNSPRVLSIDMRDNVSTFCPRGTHLVTGNESHIEIWDWEKGTDAVLSFRHGIDTPVRSLAYSSCCTTLASAHGETIHIWDTGTGAQRRVIQSPMTCMTDLVSFTSQACQLVSVSNGSDGSSLITWNVKTGDRLWIRRVCTQPVQSRKVAFSSDGHFLAVAPKGVIQTWDVREGRPLQTIEGYSQVVEALAFSLDGTQLVSAHDRRLKVWDLSASGDFKADTNQHTEEIRAVKISQDGTKVVSASSRAIKIWDPKPGGGRPYTIQLRPEESDIFEVVISPDGSQVLSIPGSGIHCTLWSVAGSPRPPTRAPVEGGLAACFTSDGTTIATLDHSGTVRLCDVLNGSGGNRLLFRPNRPLSTVAVGSVAFSLSGKQVASSFDGSLYVWDLATHRRLFHKDTSETAVSLCLFSLDRRPHLAASYGHGKRLEIWDLATTDGCLVRAVEHHPASVDLGAFNEPTRLYLTNLAHDGQNTRPTRGYGLDPGLDWISWGRERVLWLPPDFRPVGTSISVALVGSDPLPETIIAYASRSNRVRILRFPAGKHPPGVDLDGAAQSDEPADAEGTADAAAVTAPDDPADRLSAGLPRADTDNSFSSMKPRRGTEASVPDTIGTVDTAAGFRDSVDQCAYSDLEDAPSRPSSLWRQLFCCCADLGRAITAMGGSERKHGEGRGEKQGRSKRRKSREQGKPERRDSLYW